MKAKLDFLTSSKSIIKTSSDQTSKSTLTILKNWLIDLLSRYHGISVKEMVSHKGGSTHFKISCTKLNKDRKKLF